MNVENQSEDDARKGMHADHLADQLRHASREYLLNRGWSTTIENTLLRLTSNDDLAALLIPVRWAELVRDELPLNELSCPVIDVRSGTWGFLARAEERSAASKPPTAPGVKLLVGGANLTLPPSVSRHGDVSWVVSPDECVGDPADIEFLLSVTDRIAHAWPGERGRRPDMHVVNPVASAEQKTADREAAQRH